MKACTQCGYTKPLLEFYAQSANKDGLTNACKPCIKEGQKRSAENKRERERRELEDLDNPGTKVCNQCDFRLPHDNFYHNPSTKDGLATVCKVCEEYLRRVRNTAPKLRTRTPDTLGYDAFKSVWNTCKRARRVPGWADQEKILSIYREKARLADQNYDIDHIVPLNGALVCGLHVQDNLQIISASENRSKGAYWNPDDPLPWEIS